MTQNTLKVQAFWDKDAEVWVATSENVPGLVTEASTIESLTQKLREIIPELLVVNRIVPSDYVFFLTRGGASQNAFPGSSLGTRQQKTLDLS